MTWVQTFTGKAVDLVTPTPEMIDPIDIVWSLSMQCRYSGHTDRFYSVAEHSCLVHDWLLDRYHDKTVALAGLLHDAHEAYLSDLPKPVQRVLPGAALAGFQRVTKGLDRVIGERFGLPDMWWADQRVREADLRILLDERDALMKPPPQDWGIDAEPLGVQIHAWPQLRAVVEFRFRLRGYVPWMVVVDKWRDDD